MLSLPCHQSPTTEVESGTQVGDRTLSASIWDWQYLHLLFYTSLLKKNTFKEEVPSVILLHLSCLIGKGQDKASSLVRK